jgi:hypothetical protein
MARSLRPTLLGLAKLHSSLIVLGPLAVQQRHPNVSPTVDKPEMFLTWIFTQMLSIHILNHAQISLTPEELTRAANPYTSLISDSGPYQSSASTAPTTLPTATPILYPFLSIEKGTPANTTSSTTPTQIDEYKEPTEYLKEFPQYEAYMHSVGLIELPGALVLAEDVNLQVYDTESCTADHSKMTEVGRDIATAAP